uniref:Uncharacterized protein n=1 Tax=Mycena chlorophos TaxID=658473 RepID=A0ABQ0LBM8_MYCCL|nr:predicted protein [Mycena chlorophos]
MHESLIAQLEKKSESSSRRRIADLNLAGNGQEPLLRRLCESTSTNVVFSLLNSTNMHGSGLALVVNRAGSATCATAPAKVQAHRAAAESLLLCVDCGEDGRRARVSESWRVKILCQECLDLRIAEGMVYRWIGGSSDAD